MGVGNSLRGDDGCGILVARKLKEKGFKNSFPCGQTPENYLGKIVSLNPDTVLIVDAVDFGGETGQVRFFKSDDVFQGLSTHTAGLNMTARFLTASSGARVMLVGIQPEKLHGKMTGRVKKASEELAKKFYRQLCTKA